VTTISPPCLYAEPEYCPFCEAERTALAAREPRHTYVVAVYLEDRAYGGPEEGGWWYDVGSLTRVVRVFKRECIAAAYCRKLNARLQSRAFGPNLGRREISSVLSDGEYCARVFADTAPAGFPERRPRYE
jgi:hypothetical protein